MGNFIFVNRSVSDSLHTLFSQVYSFTNDHHNHNTRFASVGLLKLPTNNTLINGTKLFATSTISSWKFFQFHFTSLNFKKNFLRPN